MRLLYLLTQDLESPSGIGRFFPMAREMARLGHHVYIAALHSRYSELSEKQLAIENVKINYVGQMHVEKRGNLKTYYPALRLLALTGRAAWKLTSISLSQPCDIIHVCKPHPMNSLAGLCAKFLRARRTILDCDDYEAAIGHFSSPWQKLIVLWFEDHVPFYVDHTTTNTQFTYQRMLSIGVPPSKLTYIPNGVERSRFQNPDNAVVEDLRARLGLKGNKVIGYVGSLSHPSHPIELLFEAFHGIHQKLPGVTLLLVGGGEDYPHIERKTREMGLNEYVLLVGRVPPAQVVNYYHLMDVSVDPVFDDDAARGRAPLKLFESWACGVPFVTGDVGDRRMLLGDPPAGLLAHPGDAQSLAEQIITVLSQPALADEIRQRGRERVKAYYWDRIASDLERVYANVLLR